MERPKRVPRRELKVQSALPLVRDAVSSLEQGQGAGAFAVMNEARRLGRERGQRIGRGTAFKAMMRLEESGEFHFRKPDSGEATQQPVEWPQDWTERLDPSRWNQHILPIAETDSGWEQTAPIPTFHRVETQGDISHHYLWYLNTSNDLGTNVGGRTLAEAEEKMRSSLPFDIEFGRGMVGTVQPIDMQSAVADEVAGYFRQKPESPQTQQ